MEVKDWIMLFVPITFNGILLFAFQQKILLSNKRHERKNDYQHEVLSHFLSLLQDFYTSFRNIQAIDEKKSGKQVAFSSVWNPAAELMQQLVVYRDTHPIATQEVNLSFQACAEEWQKIATMLYESSMATGGYMTKEVAVQFSHEYEMLDVLIKDCLKICEKEILSN